MLSKNVLNETNILIPYMYDKYIILILNTKSTYLYMKRICKKKKKKIENTYYFPRLHSSL